MTYEPGHGSAGSGCIGDHVVVPTSEAVSVHHQAPRTQPTTAPRRLRRAAVALAVVLATSATLADPVLAVGDGDETLGSHPADAPRPSALPSPSVLGVDPGTGISPELSGVEVDSSRYRSAVAAFADVEEAHHRAQVTRVEAEVALQGLQEQSLRLRAELTAAEAAEVANRGRLVEVGRRIRAFAVEAYVERGGVTLSPDPDEVNATQRAQATLRVVDEIQIEELAAAEEALEEALDQRVAVGADLTVVEGQITTTEATRAQAAADEQRRTERLGEAQQEGDRAWMTAEVVGTDLTLVALDAYFRAARTLAGDRPSCGLRWSAIAGISRVEGRHGTYGGSSVDADGDTTARIIGIALDGTGGTAAIADTDGGRLDGDSSVDRAVGPMQFIPSTWSQYARDGNGDDRRDPHNLYDAALAAAAYLCAGRSGLEADASLRSAFLVYNRSGAYADQVLGFTHGYDRFVIPPPQPTPNPGAAGTTLARQG